MNGIEFDDAMVNSKGLAAGHNAESGYHCSIPFHAIKNLTKSF